MLVELSETETDMICTIFEDENTGETFIALDGLDAGKYQKFVDGEVQVQFFPDVYFLAENGFEMPDITDLQLSLLDSRVYFEVNDANLPSEEFLGNIYI